MITTARNFFTGCPDRPEGIASGRATSGRGWARASVILLLFAGSAASAQLTWTTESVVLSVEANQEKAVAVYDFFNAGPRPVRVSGLRTNCGCAQAACAMDVFQPGEKGQVEVTYHVGTDPVSSKLVTEVCLDGSQAPAVMLKLDVTIIHEFICSPRLLLWRRNENAEPKVFEISAVGEKRIGRVSADASPRVQSVEIETVEAGRRYRCRVIPKGTLEFAIIPLKFTVEVEHEPPTFLKACILIK